MQRPLPQMIELNWTQMVGQFVMSLNPHIVCFNVNAVYCLVMMKKCKRGIHFSI